MLLMPRIPPRLLSALTSVALALLVSACATTSGSFQQGQSLVEQGRVDEALAKFRAAMREEPRMPEYRAAYLQTLERAVNAELVRAERSLGDGNTPAAQASYQRVLELEPGNGRAMAGLRRIDQGPRHRQWLQEAQAALLRSDSGMARARLSAVLAEDPRNETALALRSQLDGRATTPSEVALASAYAKTVTIEFKDVALRQIFEVLARSSGLNFLFDKDVRIDQKTSIYLKNSSVQSAVHFMLMANQLDQQVLDANTILVYPNTVAKQREYQPTDIRTFYLTSADAKTVAATLRTIVKSRDVVVDEKLNMLIVRDTPEAIRLAEKLVALHDLPEPEVMLEVEILEVSRTRLLELGIKWPTSLSLTPLASVSGGVLTLNDLKQNISSSTLGASLSPIVLNARNADTDTNILANPRIRARNKEKAKILIGSKVPNITTTSTSTGFVSESITYLDVGLKLEVEPTVYLDDDVAIRISLEVSNILDQIRTNSGSVAFRIGTRSASTVLRLKDGENQVLAGLINDEDRRTADKVPGFGEIPVLGRLFGSSNDDRQKSEIVLSITPRLVRNIQRPDAGLAQFRAGTETSLRQMPPSAGSVSIPRPAVMGQQQRLGANPLLLVAPAETVQVEVVPATAVIPIGPAGAAELPVPAVPDLGAVPAASGVPAAGGAPAAAAEASDGVVRIPPPPVLPARP